MKKTLLFATTALILAACGGGGTPAPTPTPVPTPSVTPTPTPNPAPSPNPSGYPYNPPASTTQSSDPRVPYYGEWQWVAAFSNGDTFTGRMSINAKEPIYNDNFFNGGEGAGTWCTDGTFSCPYIGDLSSIDTYKNDDGTFDLSTSLYDVTAKTVKFIADDDDKVIGSEVNGHPSFVGKGTWYYYSGSSANIGFAMSQVSTTPAVSADVDAAPQFIRIAMPHRISSQSASDLQEKAVRTLIQLQGH